MVGRWHCPQAWLPDCQIWPDVHVSTFTTVQHKQVSLNLVISYLNKMVGQNWLKSRIVLVTCIVFSSFLAQFKVHCLLLNYPLIISTTCYNFKLFLGTCPCTLTKQKLNRKRKEPLGPITKLYHSLLNIFRWQLYTTDT